MDKNEVMQRLATGGIVGTLSAFIRALMTKNESLVQKVKTFTAGVCMAVLVSILLIEAPLKEFWKQIIIGVFAAFISTLWPYIETFVIKFFKKKTDDIIKNNDPV